MYGRYCLDTPRAELQQLLRSWLRPEDSAWLEPGDGAHRRALEPMLTPAPAEPWDCRALKPADPANKHQQLSLLD